MSSEEQDRARQNRIVVGVDGSQGSIAALRWAAGWANSQHAVLEAVIAWTVPVSAAPLFIPPKQMFNPQTFEFDATRTLDDSVREVFGDSPPHYLQRVVREGNAAGVLLAESMEADELVVGPRGIGGFTGLLVGSVSEQCVRHARCTVVVAR